MMFIYRKILFLTISYILYVQCVVPNLSVQKLDRRVIKRKRQDTLEMCRIFTEETARLEKLNKAGDFNVYMNHNNQKKQEHNRMKRNVNPPNPALTDNAYDMQRVERIVDKLYDDMEERGQKVTYRQRHIATVTTDKTMINTTARRLFFAPAVLLGPPGHIITDKNHTDRHTWDWEGGKKVPWHKKWKQGIIPYFIDPNTYDSLLSDTIIKAFDYFERNTCIRLQRLREKPIDKLSLKNVEWLYITNPYGLRQCVHSNERKANSGVQMVVFGYDCLSLGEIVHEVMHILGFSHEHTRPDRDEYVTIVWDNIKPGYKKYFAIRSDDASSSVPYDYASVLHYPARAFSKNGQVTILTKGNFQIGQREELSKTDVEKIGTIYDQECSERNRQYLLKTCPNVVKVKLTSETATQKEIDSYFKDRIWPLGKIEYRLRDQLEFSAEERENIKAVIRHIEKETCIKFHELPPDPQVLAVPFPTNYTHKLNSVINEITTPAISDNEIKESDLSDKDKSVISTLNTQENSEESQPTILDNNAVLDATTLSPSRRHTPNVLTIYRSVQRGCQCPPPGKQNGTYKLEINADCFNSVNDLLHLFVHVLGLDHQHNMHDRDSFLHIVWSNLTQEIEKDLKNKLPPAAAVGFPYDYHSVMHYPWLQIKNGVTSIMYPIWNDGWAMGNWQGLSSTDVQKLNRIYAAECAKHEKLAMYDEYR